jgi:hypothetical protein
MFESNDMIKTGSIQQTVENAVLLNSCTVNGLLNIDVESEMTYITTPFGAFDCPVFFRDGNWESMNGETANVVIDDGFHNWTDIGSETLGEWEDGIFGNRGNGSNLSNLWALLPLWLSCLFAYL